MGELFWLRELKASRNLLLRTTSNGLFRGWTEVC